MPGTTATFAHERAADRSRRRFALHGGDVGRWFVERGWEPLRQPTADGHAFIDELVTPSIAVRRIWHTPMRLTAHGAPLPGRVSAWLQVDGELSVTDRLGTDSVLPTGCVYFHSGHPAAITSTHATARIEVTLDSRVLDPDSAPQRGDCGSSSTWSALIGAVNSLLNASDLPGPQALSLVTGAIESLTKALWHESTTTTGTHSGNVLVVAMSLIERNAADPSFTVTTLAARLGITRTHLTRVFREEGMQPSGLLRDRRLSLAESMLARDPRADLGAVAAASGFPSRRVLREALQERYELRNATPQGPIASHHG